MAELKVPDKQSRGVVIGNVGLTDLDEARLKPKKILLRIEKGEHEGKTNRANMTFEFAF